MTSVAMSGMLKALNTLGSCWSPPTLRSVHDEDLKSQTISAALQFCGSAPACWQQPSVAKSVCSRVQQEPEVKATSAMLELIGGMLGCTSHDMKSNAKLQCGHAGAGHGGDE